MWVLLKFRDMGVIARNTSDFRAGRFKIRRCKAGIITKTERVYIMGMLRKIGARVGQVASKVVNKIKNNKLMVSALSFGLLASSAFAETTSTGTSTVEIVTKGSSGEISFSPEALFQPLVDAILSSYKYWAVIVLIFVVVSVMVWIFKKK